MNASFQLKKLLGDWFSWRSRLVLYLSLCADSHLLELRNKIGCYRCVVHATHIALLTKFMFFFHRQLRYRSCSSSCKVTKSKNIALFSLHSQKHILCLDWKSRVGRRSIENESCENAQKCTADIMKFGAWHTWNTLLAAPNSLYFAGGNNAPCCDLKYNVFLNGPNFVLSFFTIVFVLFAIKLKVDSLGNANISTRTDTLNKNFLLKVLLKPALSFGYVEPKSMTFDWQWVRELGFRIWSSVWRCTMNVFWIYC